MITVGLTGGIGSGKTTVSELFAQIGIPIFNTDLAAKDARAKPYIKKKLITAFGEDAVLTEGQLDTKKLSDIIFNDDEKLKIMTDIISEDVIIQYRTFCKKNKKADYVIMESAILRELGIADKFDFIISVLADRKTRIERVKKRSGLSEGEVIARMEHQSDDNILRIMADFVITNDFVPDGNYIDLLNEQVKFIDKKLKLAKKLRKDGTESSFMQYFLVAIDKTVE